MNLKNTIRTYKSQLIITYTVLALSLVFVSQTSWIEDNIPYKLVLILLLIIVPIMYTYILLLKNYIDDIEKIKPGNIKNEHTEEIKEIDLKPLQQSLHSLSSEEKEYLNRYISNNTKTQYFDVRDGIACGLVGSHIIYRSSNLGHAGTWNFAHNIQPWAWEYLQKNKHLLK